MRKSIRRFTVDAHIVFEIFALQLANGLFEQLHVHLEADRVDLPALLAAKKVSCAANFEVERGDAEPAPQIAELLDGGEPLARDGRQRFFGRNQQIRKGRAIAATHASAQLIELRQAHTDRRD